MSLRSFLLAIAVLLAVIAAPASLHAAGLQSLLPASHGGSSLHSASFWSFDGMLNLVHQFGIDDGGTLDPSGGAKAAPHGRPAPHRAVDSRPRGDARPPASQRSSGRPDAH